MKIDMILARIKYLEQEKAKTGMPPEVARKRTADEVMLELEEGGRTAAEAAYDVFCALQLRDRQNAAKKGKKR